MINFENYNLGVDEYEKQNYKSSIDYFTKSILDNQTLGNSFSLAYFFRASSYFFLEEYYKAIKDFEEASIAMFDDYRVYYFKGLSHFNLKHYDEAISDLNKTIELKNDFEDSYIKLYEIYRIICSNKLAKEMLVKTIAINPNNIDVVSKLCEKYNYENFGDLSKMFQLDFFSLFPDDPNAINLSKEIASTMPKFSSGSVGNRLYLSYILIKNRKLKGNSDLIIEKEVNISEEPINEIISNKIPNKKMNIKNRLKNIFASINSLGKEESLENIIKSVIISLLFGITIALIIGWITSESRTFYDISDSDGNRIERTESSFNYGTGLILGSISTLVIFIRRLLVSKNN